MKVSFGFKNIALYRFVIKMKLLVISFSPGLFHCCLKKQTVYLDAPLSRIFATFLWL